MKESDTLARLAQSHQSQARPAGGCVARGGGGLEGMGGEDDGLADGLENCITIRQFNAYRFGKCEVTERPPAPSSARPRVVVTCAVHPAALEPLGGLADCAVNEATEPYGPEELACRARDAMGLLAFMPDRIDGALLRACPSLRIVALAAKGFDNFDRAAFDSAGVWLTAVPDLLSGPTAELAVALLLGLARRVPEGDRLVRSGGFRGWRPRLYGLGLEGATVGLLGMGGVGEGIARRLRGFGCRLLYSDPRALPPEAERRLDCTRVEADALVAAADALLLALPLTEGTAGLVDAAFLARLKPGCLLVNPARGSLVDETAVAGALESGRLGGYAADVFAFEDLARPERPAAVPSRLLAKAERTLFTPHLGSAVAEVRHAIVREAALNLRDVIEGRPPRGAVNRPLRPREAGP